MKQPFNSIRPWKIKEMLSKDRRKLYGDNKVVLFGFKQVIGIQNSSMVKLPKERNAIESRTLKMEMAFGGMVTEIVKC